MTCSVDVCDRDDESRGYCNTHYEWYRRHGFQEQPTHKIGSIPYQHERSDRKCSVEGCDKPHVGRGYCGAHYKWAERRNFEEEPTYRIGNAKTLQPRRPKTINVDALSPKEIGWVAGILDGEGHMRFDANRGANGLGIIQVRMTCHKTIARLHSLLPVGGRMHKHPKQKENEKTQWGWHMYRANNIIPLLKSMEDILVEKKEKARHILQKLQECQ